MKKRNGFVSNSSSTSFLIGGFNVKATDISTEDIKNNTYMVEGREWCNADDVFVINDVNMLYFLKTAEKFIKMNMTDNDKYYELKFNIYEVLTNIEGDEYEIKVDLSSLPEKGIMSVVSLEQDYGSSENVSDLFDRYMYNIDNVDLRNFNAIYTKYQRKDKLNKINDKN